MAAIAAAVETSPYPRIGVSLSAWAADGPVTVYRVHADTTRWPVRGTSDVSGAVAFGYDYEAPHAAPVHYEAVSGSTLIQSSDAVIPLTSPYLSVPGLPQLATSVSMIAKPAVGRVRPRTILQPIGRSTAIVLGDNRKAGSFKLGLLTRSIDAAAAITAMLDRSGVLLLRMPGTRYAWQYVDVGNIAEEPVQALLPDAGSAGALWSWDLDCVVTDPPVGGIYGDPTATWQALLDTGKTWGDLVSAGRTWLDLLRGNF